MYIIDLFIDTISIYPISWLCTLWSQRGALTNNYSAGNEAGCWPARNECARYHLLNRVPCPVGCCQPASHSVLVICVYTYIM